VTYVFCQKCNYPGIILVVYDGKVQGNCILCGGSNIFDNKDKMTVYILKNPPNNNNVRED